MSDTLNSGGPAFPLAATYHKECGYLQPDSFGMMLRDYFAAAALTGLVVSNRMDCMNGTQHPDRYAEDAYCIADAMIKARLP